MVVALLCLCTLTLAQSDSTPPTPFSVCGAYTTADLRQDCYTANIAQRFYDVQQADKTAPFYEVFPAFSTICVFAVGFAIGRSVG